MQGLRPKTSVRMLMLAVLVIGVLLSAAASWLERRREFYARRAAWYAGIVWECREIAKVSIPWVSRRLDRKARRYEAIAREYQRAAAQPWRPSPADPQPPSSDW